MFLRRRTQHRLLAGCAVIAVLTGTGAVAATADEPPPPVHTFQPPADPDTMPNPPLLTPTDASTAPTDQLRRRSTLNLSVANLCTGTGSGSGAVKDGQPILVALPPAKPFAVGALPAVMWTEPPSPDAGWRLWFYSMRWAQSVMSRAYQDAQPKSMKAVVDQVLSFYTQHPDKLTGATPAGWDEGSSLRRLETLNCLYAATPDPRIKTAMAAEARVLTGKRYYGPPNAGVHNHGLMANVRLAMAGELIGRADWVQIARKRIASEAPLAFTPAGTTFEQSSGYHKVNANMWNNAAAVLSVLDPSDPTPAKIRSTLAKSARVVQWFTEPDGKLVQIGDTTRTAGFAASAGRGGLFRDDKAGVLVGRWAWNNPLTSYYTVRYGPRRWAHGHFDKASVTWTTRGARVLVGPGYTTHDPVSPKNPWHLNMAAHNTSTPTKGRFNPKATAALRAAKHSYDGQVATSTVDESSYGTPHRRITTVDHNRGRLTVDDIYNKGVRNVQNWHLDPTWTLVSAPLNGTVMRFKNPADRVLTVTTSGRLALATKGSPRKPGGWTYLQTDQRTASYYLVIASVGNTVRTTFRVQ